MQRIMVADDSVENMLNDLAFYGQPTTYACSSTKGTWYCKLEYLCREGVLIQMESSYGKVGLKEAVLECKESLIKYLTEEKP